MATNWDLVRQVMTDTISACKAIEELAPDLAAGEYEARSDYQEDVCVGDFLNRFWQYPEGAARDIVRLRTRVGEDQKHPSETGRALIHAAVACAEVIGLSGDGLGREESGFVAHCGSGGHSAESLLTGISKVQNGWIVPGVTKALAAFRHGQPPQVASGPTKADIEESG